MHAQMQLIMSNIIMSNIIMKHHGINYVDA